MEQEAASPLAPRNIVVMQNCGLQAGERQVSQLRFLLPYSTDLNPIEMTYSKIRALLKKAMG